MSDEDDFFDEGEDEHGPECDCEECTFERAMYECGRIPDHLGGGCTKAGSEHCDFDCPFSRALYENAEGDE